MSVKYPTGKDIKSARLKKYHLFVRSYRKEIQKAYKLVHPTWSEQRIRHISLNRARKDVSKEYKAFRRAINAPNKSDSFYVKAVKRYRKSKKRWNVPEPDLDALTDVGGGT